MLTWLVMVDILKNNRKAGVKGSELDQTSLYYDSLLVLDSEGARSRLLVVKRDYP